MNKNSLLHTALCLTALAATAALTACSEDDTPVRNDDKTGNIVTLNAQIAPKPTTRLIIGDDTGAAGTETRVYWSDDTSDLFSLHYAGGSGTDSYLFQKSATTTNATSASFTCTNAPTLSGATTLYAVYPGIADNKANASSIPFDLSRQSGTKADAATRYDFMAAKAENVDNITDAAFNFAHKVAIVRLTVTNSDFKGKDISVILSATGLMSKAEYSFASDAWAVSTGSVARVRTPENIAADASTGAATAYLAVFPGSLTDCKAMATANSKLYEAPLADITLVAGNLYRASVTMTEVPALIATTTLASDATYDYDDLDMQIGTYDTTTPANPTQTVLSTAPVIAGKAYFPMTDLQPILTGSGTEKIWLSIPKVAKFFHTLTADEWTYQTLSLPDKDDGSTLKTTPTADGKPYENDWIVALYMGINKNGLTTADAAPLYWATGNLIATKTGDTDSDVAFHIADARQTEEQPTQGKFSDYENRVAGSQWALFGHADPTGLLTKNSANYPQEQSSGNEYDIARKQLGGIWRLPVTTYEEKGNELAGFFSSYTTLPPTGESWMDAGTYMGQRFTYEITAANGHKITNILTFPVTYYRVGTEVKTDTRRGIYRSGTYYSGGGTLSYIMGFPYLATGSGTTGTPGKYEWGPIVNGYAVRPVTE